MKGDRLIEEIKTRVDIVDVISDAVDLKRAGQNYKGLCPFHAEKTPSFMVSPSKQIFHCFGCHKGGDVLTFVMDYDHVTFQEAVSSLSRRAGIPVEEYTGTSSGQQAYKDTLFRIQREAALFFSQALSGSQRALRYLNERGVSDETRDAFSLGYSGSGRDGLLLHLKGTGFPVEAIRQCGLLHGDAQKAHDFFRDRIMFPLCDLQDRPIAFGGRILTSLPHAPKYLNSTDSPIFRKGESLYALNKARHAVAQKGYVLIVEGYLDVLMCHQHGITHAVAPLGTALTAGQIRKLKRFADKILLVFDGDAAGRAATKRSLELAFAEGMTAKVFMLPNGEDPDSMLRRRGAEDFRKRMAASLTPVAFAFEAFGRRRLDAARYVLSLLCACGDPLLREETLRELAEVSRMSEVTLREEIRAMSRRKPHDRVSPGTRLGSDASPEEPARLPEEERILLTIALTSPDHSDHLLSRIMPGHFTHPLVAGVFEKMRAIAAAGASGPIPLETLLSHCEIDEQRLVTSLTINPEIDPLSEDDNITDCIRKLALRSIEKEIISAEQSGDEKRLQELLSEKSRLVLQRDSR
jgi:DNA primase